MSKIKILNDSELKFLGDVGDGNGNGNGYGGGDGDGDGYGDGE